MGFSFDDLVVPDFEKFTKLIHSGEIGQKASEHLMSVVEMMLDEVKFIRGFFIFDFIIQSVGE
jgi:hypothetical protein